MSVWQRTRSSTLALPKPDRFDSADTADASLQQCTNRGVADKDQGLGQAPMARQTTHGMAR